MAFGYTVGFRILRLFNFAHGGVFMLATFAALFVARGVDAGNVSGAIAVTGAIGAMLLASVGCGIAASVGLEYAVFRPIRVRGGGTLPALVAGLGALTLIQEIVAKWQGRDQIVVPQPLGVKPLLQGLGGSIDARQVLIVVAAVVVIGAIERYTKMSRLGRALRAVGEDATTASLMGVNVGAVVILGFALAGATAGVAGALWDIYFGTTSWFAGFGVGLEGITAALLGGIGSVTGALVGGLVLGVTESYGGAIFGAQWQSVIAFGVLVVLLLVRPTGIVGQRASMVRA